MRGISLGWADNAIWRVITVGILVVRALLATAAAAETVPFPPHHCEYVHCPTGADTDKEDEVEPIRRLGETISVDAAKPDRHIQDRYFPIMRRFPNVESCLDSSNPAAQLLTDAKMKWRELSSEPAAYVCLFRLFDAMRNSTLAAQWLSDNGFSDVRDLPGDQERRMIYSDSAHTAGEVRVVSAYWPTSKNGRLYGSVLSAFFESLVSLGIELHAVFDRDGNVLWIEIGSNPRFPK